MSKEKRGRGGPRPGAGERKNFDESKRRIQVPIGFPREQIELLGKDYIKEISLREVEKEYNSVKNTN